jgi:catabolite regulation protein CreA
MNFSGNTNCPEVTNCTGYIDYIDRVIMHKTFAKDANEAAVAYFKI